MQRRKKVKSEGMSALANELYRRNLVCLAPGKNARRDGTQF